MHLHNACDKAAPTDTISTIPLQFPSTISRPCETITCLAAPQPWVRVIPSICAAVCSPRPGPTRIRSHCGSGAGPTAVQAWGRRGALSDPPAAAGLRRLLQPGVGSPPAGSWQPPVAGGWRLCAAEVPGFLRSPPGLRGRHWSPA